MSLAIVPLISHFPRYLPPLCLSLPRLVCLTGRLSLGLSVSLGNPSGPGISMQTSLVIAFSTAQAASAPHDATHPTSVVCSLAFLVPDSDWHFGACSSCSNTPQQQQQH